MKIGKILACVLLGAVLVGAFACRIFHDHSDLAPGKPFSAARKAEINRVFSERMEKAGMTVTPEQLLVSWIDDDKSIKYKAYIGPFMYFGVFDNAMVIYNTGGAHLDVMTPVRLGQYLFNFTSSTTPTVIFEGELYGFKEAYDKGILTDEAAAQLHAYYGSDAYRDAYLSGR